MSCLNYRTAQPARGHAAQRGQAAARRGLRARDRGAEGDDQGQVPQHLQEALLTSSHHQLHLRKISIYDLFLRMKSR